MPHPARTWQWINHPAAKLADGRQVSLELCRQIAAEELAKIESFFGAERFAEGKFDLANQILDELIAREEFAEFLTWISYDYLD